MEGPDGKSHMTLGWHVDDFIITHQSEQAIDDSESSRRSSELVETLNKEYGGTTPLTVHRGKVHKLCFKLWQ